MNARARQPFVAPCPLPDGGPPGGRAGVASRASARPRSVHPLAGATLAALALHAGLLGRWWGASPPSAAVPEAAAPAARAPVAAFAVRAIAAAPRPVDGPSPAAARERAAGVPAATAPAAAARLAATVHAPSGTPARPPPKARPVALAEPVAPLTPPPTTAAKPLTTPARPNDNVTDPGVTPAHDAAPVAAVTAHPQAGEASAPPPPTYRTAPPPSLQMSFGVRRGGLHGTAQLRWQRDDKAHGDAGTRYVLELHGGGAAPALTPHWTSRGAFDVDGLAPERFAVSRRGRERHAANFRRDAGIVSFAGPSETWPLVGGAQDRLSWIVQLAAVLEAAPALAAAGQRLSMMVVGAHGDAGLWTFVVQPQRVIEGPAGTPLPVWPLVRESGGAHDPQVEAWLAPSLHHLPVRLRFTLPAGGESTEMRLTALQAP